ncbi:MAG: 23S rRNA (pseudouridine(1915)-N(3))-methyltransferase RlmH [Gammaproteobacteria bacterium]|jgi:23S rRNA (pseudouridine1915-N3)-methyltransferase|nr:23S rRNA (pseudouridine(1915)-N(3))-methyltransferase RlmH [Gammaproteobacteria bacterium]MDP6616754.1 23S rRNA (pseudouridine(1915)-N(3))-methyltransferase RlmH [Gammaproteobacteria bacterium]MDP6695181.1 23S rRNA (pseudouridine(1915)-N(3))-methyltransferase RlmH [Gammaproteobacteria bacterium]MDP7041482.1 23S rRNA (pseudouridine(1915)-N(3))-methyltransferase RlmH [Gammaproteobacteria bacterium]
MQLTALVIGTRMPSWVEEGVATYTKRLPRHIALSFRELPAAQRSSGSDVSKQKALEGERLLKALPEPAYCVALDEHGKSCTSVALAGQLEDWLASHSQVAFMIGGADGLAEPCMERADRIWSLSPLTLPHALVRVLLAEQIYRAWTVLQGHPYHRD